VVEGNIHVTEGQSLTLFMTTRRFFANLTEVKWVGESQQLEHLGLRAELIYWAAPLAEDMHVSATLPPTRRERWAELIMDDGTRIKVGLYIAEEQRLTDYIDAATGYLPVRDAIINGREESLGEIVVNTGSVMAIREIDPPRRF
jgi:hypothetical protein